MMLSPTISTVLELVGMILVTIAALMVFVPAGLAVSGLFCLAVGVVGGRS